MPASNLRLAPALLALSLAAAPAQGDDLDRRVARAVKRSASYLIRRQQEGVGAYGTKNRLALTSMATLALMSSGSTPRRGPYSQRVLQSVRWVLSCQRRRGGELWHPSNGYSGIHNHGYALTLLTQAYGECGTELDTRIARAVRLAIRCSSESQHGNGGFGYFIRRVIPEGNVMFTGDEASTTISQIQALRGARNAGFEVPARMLARAGDYISESQHAPTGGFVYSLQTGQVSFAKDSDTPTFAISAASACVLNALGKYRGPKLERALTYIETFEPPTNRATYFFYYGHYYAAQVMRQVGGARGKRWRRAILEELTRRQESDGSFPKTSDSHVAGEDGTILNTAWALQIMTMDGGVLPIFER